MADNIKLVTYAGSTVTPLDDALVHETAIANSGIIYGAEVTMKSSNVLHITAGHGLICGRKFTIIESDISVQLTSGVTYLGRVYVHMDLSNTTEPIQLLIETAATLTKVVQQSNVNIINGIFEFNLATFEIDASTISNVVNVAPKVSAQNTEEMKELFVQKTDILKSMEEVTANKDENMVVGPEAVAELNKNIQKVKTYVGADGKLHFVDASGADSVLPFNKGVILTKSVTVGSSNVTSVSFSIANDYADYKNLTIDNLVIQHFSRQLTVSSNSVPNQAGVPIINYTYTASSGTIKASISTNEVLTEMWFYRGWTYGFKVAIVKS